MRVGRLSRPLAAAVAAVAALVVAIAFVALESVQLYEFAFSFSGLLIVAALFAGPASRAVLDGAHGRVGRTIIGVFMLASGVAAYVADALIWAVFVRPGWWPHAVIL